MLFCVTTCNLACAVLIMANVRSVDRCLLAVVSCSQFLVHGLVVLHVPWMTTSHNTYMDMHMHIHAQVNARRYTHTSMRTNALTCTHIHTYTHAHTHTWTQWTTLPFLMQYIPFPYPNYHSDTQCLTSSVSQSPPCPLLLFGLPHCLAMERTQIPKVLALALR